MDKEAIRRQMLMIRKAMTEAEAEGKSRIILDDLITLPEYRRCTHLMTYVSFQQEVSTLELLAWRLAEGKTTSVPYCMTQARELYAMEIDSLEDLAENTFGLLEPRPGHGRIQAPSSIDLILLPGLAFDGNGNRIGFGAGYYDRFLARVPSHAVKIALAYSFQVLPEVPRYPWDIPADLIVTEQGILRCSKS